MLPHSCVAGRDALRAVELRGFLEHGACLLELAAILEHESEVEQHVRLHHGRVGRSEKLDRFTGERLGVDFGVGGGVETGTEGTLGVEEGEAARDGSGGARDRYEPVRSLCVGCTGRLYR